MATTFHAFRSAVTTSGTPVQLDSFSVEPDQTVLIKAKSTNTGVVSIGNTSAEAIKTNAENFLLAAGQSVVLKVPNTNQIWVDSTASSDIVEVVIGGSGAFSGAISGSVSSGGDVAHDAVDSGNPVKVGGQARTTNPTAVADADRTNFIADKLGKQVVVGSIRDLKGDQLTTITSSTSETTIVTAVASTFLDLYGLIITNNSATVCKVTIKDDTAGTTRAIFEVPATETRGFMLPESAAFKQAVVNKPWTATCGTSVDNIVITALYVKNT